MDKQEVRDLYREVKRRKVNSGKKESLIESRPKKNCGCGGKAKKVK